MFRSIVEKYGVVNFNDMPETFHSQNSREFIKLHSKLLCSYALELMDMEIAKYDELVINHRIEQMKREIYDFLCLFLGTPPNQITVYKDCLNQIITPVEYSKKILMLDLSNYISLVNIPEPYRKYGYTYTIKNLGYCDSIYPIKYLNISTDKMFEYVKSLESKKGVWFACDVRPCYNQKKDYGYFFF